MKVVMIIPYFIPCEYGAELYAYNVAKYLVKKKHEVHVITKKHTKNLKDFEIIDGINIHRTRTFNIPKLRSFLSIPEMLFKLFKLSKDADLVHAHISYPAGILALINKKILHKPYLVTSQGDELMNYPEKKALHLIRPLIKSALKNADHIHSISLALKKSMIRFFKVDKNKIKIIPNGVDLKLFNKAKKVDIKWRYKAKYVLINASRLTKKNGIDKLIKAMINVDKRALLLIAGDGPEKQSLEDLVKKLRVNVIFLGRLDHKDLPSLLKGSDIFVRTSITEGMGNVFLEAMAANIPVVASNVAAIPEIVRHNKNGLLVNPYKTEQISNSINRLIKNKGLREKLKKEGSKFVKKYDWDFVNRETFKIYKKILFPN